MNASHIRFLNKAATSTALNRLAKMLLPDWVTVFMLHRLEVPELGISGLNPSHLERCLEYLCEHDYRFISLDDAVTRALSGTLGREKWVAFSLDDGFAEQVTLAGAIFAKFDCPATCFLLTGFIDGQLWQWEHQIIHLLGQTRQTSLTLQLANTAMLFNLQTPKAHRPIIAAIRKHSASTAYEVVEKIATELQLQILKTPPIGERPATWDEIRAMEMKGMKFGAHTATHRIISGLSDEEQQQEITHSLTRLRQECKSPSSVFCYPSGQAGEYDGRAFNKLRDAGITAAVSAQPNYLNGPQLRANSNYRYAIPRMAMPLDFDEFTFYASWIQYIYEGLNSRNNNRQQINSY